MDGCLGELVPGTSSYSQSTVPDSMPGVVLTGPQQGALDPDPLRANRRTAASVTKPACPEVQPRPTSERSRGRLYRSPSPHSPSGIALRPGARGPQDHRGGKHRSSRARSVHDSFPSYGLVERRPPQARRHDSSTSCLLSEGVKRTGPSFIAHCPTFPLCRLQNRNSTDLSWPDFKIERPF